MRRNDAAVVKAYMRWASIVLAFASMALAQTPPKRPSFDEFEVATIKPTPPDWRNGRYILMTGPRQFFAPNFTARALIAAAYSLTPEAILGGPTWLDSDHYDINATTPGGIRPNLDEQMAMLRKLLVDRLALKFHREEKEFSVYS